jgi:hypothetical membrane protein
MHSNRKRFSLALGVIAGPLYLLVGLAQALVRDGFDLGRHALSLLANGPGGWVQTANFVICGLFVIAAAIGIGSALRPHSRVAGWILAGFGVGMLVAAVFPADPVDGFPPGTPLGPPTTVSTSGVIHFVGAGLGFLALAVSCIAVGVAMSRRKQAMAAALSILSGVCVIAGFVAPALVPAAGPVAGIWFSVVVGWTWLSLTSGHLARATR